MTEHVTMQDGSEQSLQDHLRDGHHKGTRGYTEDYLRNLHHTLHQRTREDVELAHRHPGEPEPGTPG